MNMIFDESFFSAYYQCFRGSSKSYLDYISNPKINKECYAISINDCILTYNSQERRTLNEIIPKLNCILQEHMNNPSFPSFHDLAVVFDLILFCREKGDYEKALDYTEFLSTFSNIPDEFFICTTILRIYILFDLHFLKNLPSEKLQTIVSPCLQRFSKLLNSLTIPRSFRQILDYEFNLLSSLVSLELCSVKSCKKHISEVAQLGGIDLSVLSTSLYTDAKEVFLINHTSPILFFLPFSSHNIEFVSPVYLKGYLEYRRGNYIKVLSTCSMVDGPVSSFVHSLMGSSELALGHYDKALYHYNSIKEGLTFHQGQTHKILGIVYILKSRYQLASVHLSKAAKLLPEHPCIWFYYALSILGTTRSDRHRSSLLLLQNCLDVCKESDVDWKYWAYLLRISIFDECSQPLNVLREVKWLEELVAKNSSFSRCTLESKQYISVIKAESSLQLHRSKEAIESVDPQIHSDLYPQCVLGALETKDWSGIQPVDDRRLHELLSILIKSHVEAENLEAACFFAEVLYKVAPSASSRSQLIQVLSIHGNRSRLREIYKEISCMCYVC